MNTIKRPSNVIPFVIPAVQEQPERKLKTAGDYWRDFWQYRKQNPPKVSFRKWLKGESERNAEMNKWFIPLWFGFLLLLLISRLING